VALISREPGTDVQRNLPNYEDPQQRLLAATYPSPDGPVRVICAYCPNGQSLESEKVHLQAGMVCRLARLAGKKNCSSIPV